MRAVGYYHCLPVAADDALVDLELPSPSPQGRDLRVIVKSVSVNPVDAKLRIGAQPPAGGARVLGFDAAGVVDSVGPDATLFKPGDEVFYSGVMNRPGTNSELHLVDERIVGPKPQSLSFPEAAALPLTSVTAWEILFDRLGVAYGAKSESGALLIINGAGGVGSVLTQLARRLTGLTVIATASRPETIAWCLQMGAHHVIDRRKPLAEGLKALDVDQAEYVASLTASDKHLPGIAEVIAPQGKLALIDDPDVFDIVPLKRKSVSVHWELMFTRPLFQTPDMIQQHRALTEVSELVDAGVLKTTLKEEAGAINAANLKRVHALIESGASVGKVVLSGFDS